MISFSPDHDMVKQLQMWRDKENLSEESEISSTIQLVKRIIYVASIMREEVALTST